MKDGFVKIACATPDIHVADCDYNAKQIIKLINEAAEKGAKLIAFPELCITGYNCGDLFLQDLLIKSAADAVLKIVEETKNLDIVSIVGVPARCNNKLYNCAAVITDDWFELIPKKNIPNYSEFYEARHFTAAKEVDDFQDCEYLNKSLSVDCVFRCHSMNCFSFGVEICEDLWVGDTPSVKLAKQGANLIVNLSCSDEIIGKADYRRTIIKAKSGSLLCAYAYADAGIGESTTDMVFAGHNIIAENGSIIAESERFKNQIIYADIDFRKIECERSRSNTFENLSEDYVHYFDTEFTETKLERYFPQKPFVPSSRDDLAKRCNEISRIQAVGLMTRLRHIGCKNAVIGLSGGLDSTLALIVTVNAFDMLGLDRKGIIAVTMPCFGTTDRTYNNACELAKSYGATLVEINIKDSVRQHFKDIGHDENIHDVTYENSQARERTQILMDIANQKNGIVIGTGDLSELALGWATYNGDHMSMYAVNASVPKTLVRYLVSYEADIREGKLKDILLDILDTPVSPELLPPEENGDIAQKTEDIVGPYELHDFFLYYMLRFGFSPSKIFRIAEYSFRGTYTPDIILKWEKTFYRRFFSQQFKRSCLPDGPKVGSVTLSPRGDFRMPSDASSALWLNELDKIQL
ncbi:MAG: NAD(+) synthase [Oscillospiraceae bacterium]